MQYVGSLDIVEISLPALTNILLKVVVIIFTLTMGQQRVFIFISSLCQLEVQIFNLIPFYGWASHLNMSSDFVQLLEQSFFLLKMWGVRSSVYIEWFSHLNCQALFSSYLNYLWMLQLLGVTSLFVVWTMIFTLQFVLNFLLTS